VDSFDFSLGLGKEEVLFNNSLEVSDVELEIFSVNDIFTVDVKAVSFAGKGADKLLLGAFWGRD